MFDTHIPMSNQHDKVLIMHTRVASDGNSQPRRPMPPAHRPKETTPRQVAEIDFNQLSRELLVALRGSRRSRPGFSKHLGYRSNIAQRWETGLCSPTAVDFFKICRRLRIDIKARVAHFLRNEPDWLETAGLDTASGLSAFLGELRGRTRVVLIAERTGFNRFSVSRWFKGTAMPRLPELLALVEACCGRCVDFVDEFVEAESLPSIANRAEALRLSREVAYQHPIAHAVLRALDLEGAPRQHEALVFFLGKHLAMAPDEAARCLDILVETKQIRRTRGGYATSDAFLVDTGGDPSRARALRLNWARLAVTRLAAGSPGQCGYRLFSISREDLRKLHELQLAHAREMSTLIANSKSDECVALYCVQLLDLAEPSLNTFPAPQPVGKPR